MNVATVVYVREVLLMTRHQLKVGLLVLVGLVVAAAAVWALKRIIGRRDEPQRDAPVAAAATRSEPFSLPVDEAVANVLTKASQHAGDTRSVDDLVDDALRVVTSIGGVSIPALQRKLEIGYERASDVVAELEARGYVSDPGPSNRRKVLPSAYERVAQLDGTTATDAEL